MGSAPRTVGVEEEFLLVDATGHPVPRGERVADASDDLEHELKLEQVETGSVPQTDLAALTADLQGRRRDLVAAAAGVGAAPVAIGTSPVPVTPTPTPDPRYDRILDTYGETAAEQLTCGCHVHVGIGSRAEGVTVLNSVQPWLAVILALSANSPFWQGADTGYASYRRMVWARWPGSGSTAPFDGPEEYDAAVAALVSSGVLLDEGMVYFDARLSAKYPTLEFRVSDVCTDLDDAVLVAALCRGLVTAAADAAAAGTTWPTARPELLRGASWRAAFSGLSGDLVDPVGGVAVPAEQMLQRLVDRAAPGLRATADLDLVEAGLERVLRRGTGAELKRAAQARGTGPRDVVQDAARRTVAF